MPDSIPIISETASIIKYSFINQMFISGGVFKKRQNKTPAHKPSAIPAKVVKNADIVVRIPYLDKK